MSFLFERFNDSFNWDIAFDEILGQSIRLKSFRTLQFSTSCTTHCMIKFLQSCKYSSFSVSLRMQGCEIFVPDKSNIFKWGKELVKFSAFSSVKKLQ